MFRDYPAAGAGSFSDHMSLQPDTDKRLAQTSRKLSANGVRLLVLALVLDVAGIILIVTDTSTVAGLFCLGLSAPIIIGAVMLMGSGAVGSRSADHKDWA